MKIIYETYKNREKINEQPLLSMSYIPTKDKIENSRLALNIQENKLHLLYDGAYTYLDLKDNILQLSNYYFEGYRKINMGDEIYLFHANDNGISVSSNQLGLLTKKDINQLIQENSLHIFIKLVCQEIN